MNPFQAQDDTTTTFSSCCCMPAAAPDVLLEIGTAVIPIFYRLYGMSQTPEILLPVGV
jgi:hypothetical protein